MCKKIDRYEFIWKCIQKHGYKYDYRKLNYNKNDNKVTITCPKHGDFTQRASDHLNGHGCSMCSGTKKSNKTEFIEKAKSIHGDRYDYSKVEYKGNKQKVCIICPLHGEFWQIPNSHLSGYGCQFCYGTHLCTTEEFIEKAKSIHGDRYDYSKVEYNGVFEKVCIICPLHGEFWQRPSNHLNNACNCPICNSNKKSKMEENIFILLNNITKNIDRQKTFEWLKHKRHLFIDFFLPEYKIAVEVQGDQHFVPIKRYGGEEYFLKQQERDKIKYNLCLKHGIKLFYVTKKNYNIQEIQDYINETMYT